MPKFQIYVPPNGAMISGKLLEMAAGIVLAFVLIEAFR